MLSIIGLFGFALSIVLMTTHNADSDVETLPDKADSETTSSKDFVFADKPSQFCEDSCEVLRQSYSDDDLDTDSTNTLIENVQNITNAGSTEAYVMDLDAGAHVSDYIPQADLIEIVYDPAHGMPKLSTRTDIGGVSLLADGSEVAYFAGLSELDLNQVVLVED